MNKRHYTTANKPRVPTTHAIDALMRQSGNVKDHNQRLEQQLARLRELAAALLSECDRGPAQTHYWPGLDVAMDRLRQELKNPQ